MTDNPFGAVRAHLDAFNADDPDAMAAACAPDGAILDGTLDFTVRQWSIRKVHNGFAAFTTMKGGAYFFLPGIGGMRYLASLGN